MLTEPPLVTSMREEDAAKSLLHLAPHLWCFFSKKFRGAGSQSGPRGRGDTSHRGPWTWTGWRWSHSGWKGGRAAWRSCRDPRGGAHQWPSFTSSWRCWMVSSHPPQWRGHRFTRYPRELEGSRPYCQNNCVPYWRHLLSFAQTRRRYFQQLTSRRRPTYTRHHTWEESVAIGFTWTTLL